ncbi:hypothetical protein VaNZ11_016602 [Volvox africanus]|uniref:Uncharacterized protein n=1 Tax=Volvox africanus TaxID=51714 RepID=A0ABQ5SN37_9CHLO|nr:hypothetical protein VaNZ11_016602 [Volvox africanus]
MFRSILFCNGISVTPNCVFGHVRCALLGFCRIPGLINTSATDWSYEAYFADNIYITSHRSHADRYVPPSGCFPQTDSSGGRQSVMERPRPSLHGVWLHPLHANAIVVCGTSPWARAAAAPSHSPHPMLLARPINHQVRSVVGTSRQHDRVDRDHDLDGRLSSYDRLRKRKRRADLDTDEGGDLRNFDDSWNEKIVSGTIASREPSLQRQGRTDQSQRGGKKLVVAAPQYHDRGSGSGDRPSGSYSSHNCGHGGSGGAVNGGGSGSGGGGSSSVYDPSDVSSVRSARGRSALYKKTQELQEGRTESQREHQLKGTQQERQWQWRRESEHDQRTARQKRQLAEASFRALTQLRGAESLRALERALDTTPSELLSPRHIATAVVTYSMLINSAQVAAAGAATTGHGDGDADGAAAAGDTWKPPPMGLKGRLRGALLQGASELGFRELSYCIYGMSMLPKAHSILTENDEGHKLSDALMNRLEVNLQELAVKLQKRKTSKEVHGTRTGGTSGGRSAAVTGDSEAAELGPEVQLLTYSCTAVRRLGIVRPSVYRALAAAAAPLLGRELSGNALPPLVLGFLEAGNPEPLFMEQLIHKSSLPYSLARTTNVFAGTILLRTAGLLGAEPGVIRPISMRLTELVKEWLHTANPQNQSSGATAAATTEAAITPAADGGSTAAAAAAAAAPGFGRGSGDEMSPSSAPPLQQRRRDRIRPSTADFQISYVLQACTAADLPPDSELVQLLIAEVKRRQAGWDLLHRLMTARHLNALGVNVTDPVTKAQETAAAAAAAGPSTSISVANASGATTSAGAGAGATKAGAEQPSRPPQPPQPPRPPHQEQQMDVPTWTLISEDEVLRFLQSPGITITLLLTVLHGLSRLNAPPSAHGDGAAAAAAGSMAAVRGGDLSGSEPLAEAATSANHRNRMPTALGVAVQLIDAAAPLMEPRQTVQALSSLLAAGVAAPPLLLQRTEQLYKDSLTGGAATTGSGSGAASGVNRMHDRRIAIAETAASGAAAAVQKDAASGDLAVTTNPAAAGAGAGAKDASNVDPDHLAGLRGGGGRRDVSVMCATVGRALAWQPAAAAAAMLSEEFVRHCRHAALTAGREDR